MKRPIFLTSFFSMKFSGSKFLTSAAIWQAKAVGSKLVMRPTPLLPASTDFHTTSVVLPTPQIKPRPVTTTLRPKLFSRLRVLADVVDRVLYGANLLRVLIGNLDVEGLFESHDQFDGIERIRAQVVHERRARGHFALIHAQLLHDNLFYLLVYGCHVFPRLTRLDLNSVRSLRNSQLSILQLKTLPITTLRCLTHSDTKKGECVV